MKNCGTVIDQSTYYPTIKASNPATWCVRERETDRQTDRQTDRKRDIEIHRERYILRNTHTHRERERERERDFN